MSPRAIRTGSWSPPKPGNERMAPSRLRACARVGLTLWLIAAAGGPLAARDVVMKFPNAQSEPIGFDALTGWNEDDQAAAFGAFLKSCNAILNAHARRCALRGRSMARSTKSAQSARRPARSIQRRRAPSSKAISSRCGSTPAGEPGGLLHRLLRDRDRRLARAQPPNTTCRFMASRPTW